MRFVEIDEIPKRRYKTKDAHRPEEYHNLKKELESFLKMDVKFVKVIFKNGEYATFKSAANSFVRASRTWMYPIKVHWIDEEIYLERTDM